MDGMKTSNFADHTKANEKTMKDMANLANSYNDWIGEEMKKTHDEFMVSTVGKIEERHAMRCTTALMNLSIFLILNFFFQHLYLGYRINLTILYKKLYLK